MKRVAIIRGANLNKYEMQTYERLNGKFEVHAIASRRIRHDVSTVHLPIHRVWCSEDLIGALLPHRLERFGLFLSNQVLGYQQVLFGLDRRLEGFDLVHTADPCYYYSYQAAAAKKRLGYKLVVTQWQNVPFAGEYLPGLRKRKYTVLRETDHFVAVTQRARETLLLEGVEERRISILPPGIDLARFKPAGKDPELLKRLRAGPEDIIISYVGRLVRSKGIEFLLWAFRKLKTDPDISALKEKVKLAFFGAGRHEKELRRRVEQWGMSDGVCFPGFFPYDQIERVYRTTDIFVLPSIPSQFIFPWQEQLGMVLLESMASECAVVTTRSGSIPEVVGDAALLCQPADFLDLYEKMRALCLGRELRKRLGAAGRERVANLYNATYNAERMAQLYDFIISGA